VPAYASNAAPMILGGGKPLDLGRKFVDGKRIFGDGKTIRGTAAGVAFGLLGAVIMSLIFGVSNLIVNFLVYLTLGAASAIGAVIGDLFGSFIKRRLNLPSGFPVPLLDQFGFILFALLIVYTVNAVFKIMALTPILLVIILIVTPFAHIISNAIVFWAGKKKEPW
jgi:CDP-2,3-bis-(O-geranylgeranyl)-sn-glycerol synthase